MILLAPDISDSIALRLAGLWYAVESALSLQCTQEMLRKIELPFDVSLKGGIALSVKPISIDEGLGFTPDMDKVLQKNQVVVARRVSRQLSFRFGRLFS